MWLLTFLFVVITLLLAWMLFGYFAFLWTLGTFRQEQRPKWPDRWPRMSVVVPCYNEAANIAEKLENLRALDYPKDQLEIVFVDGGSDDGTVDILRQAIGENDPIRVEVSPRGGKIAQINHVLPSLSGEIVVNTDADAEMASDALRWIAARFDDNPRMGVVGAYCMPRGGLDLEEYYWDSQNRARLMESDARSSSIVVAPCYAFRRELLDAFPDDVVADDIYIAFHAHARHYRVVYSREALAWETRCPETTEAFIPHKFRKSNAYLRETLRFLYLLPDMGPMCRIMLLTRIAQQLMLPWALISWAIVAGAMLTLWRWDLAGMATAFLAAMFLITSRLFKSVGVPEAGRSHARHGLSCMVRGYALTLSIMLTSALTYPFYRQGSSYARIQTRETP